MRRQASGHDKEQKSAHLKTLEKVFEERTRRFSAFEILGLKATHEGEAVLEEPAASPEPGKPTPKPSKNDPDADSSTSLTSGPGTSDPESDYIAPDPNRDTPDTNRDTPDSSGIVPDMNRNTKVVVNNKNTTTMKNRVAPDPNRDTPDSTRDTHDSDRVTSHDKSSFYPHGVSSRSDKPTPDSVKLAPDSSRDTPDSKRITPDTNRDIPDSGRVTPDPQKLREKIEGATFEAQQLQLADIVAAVHLGSQLGEKARRVLAYLNSRRSVEHEAYTVPVGYGRVSNMTGVHENYLRQKVLPKLAMLGLIGVARKSLEGTIYHLPYEAHYIQLVVAGETLQAEGGKLTAERRYQLSTEGSSAVLPDWVNREQWGWLSPETVQRLVEKAGSEERAREKLEIIVYNEQHGSLERRVRNRRSVLAHYLSSPEAEIWPNDNGFETLEIRQAHQEKERALREKELAEEALRARQEAARARFLASISEAQMQWLRQEAKRRVDNLPNSELKFLKSRYPLYKEEEERMIEEWMNRVAYGETVPAAEE